MTRASARFALPVALLALAAAIPVWRGVLAPSRHDPCREPERLFQLRSIGAGRVTEAQPAAEGPPGTGLIHGEIERPSREAWPAEFRIERSFEPSLLYGSAPLHEVDPSFALDGAGVLAEIDTGDVTLPVHWVEDLVHSNFRVRAHFFVLGGRPVRWPFVAGALLGLRQLSSGTRPVTLIVARAQGGRRDADLMREMTREWIADAWRSYREVCGPSSAGAPGRRSSTYAFKEKELR